jgi:probable HAF family extracellular repeat protein
MTRLGASPSQDPGASSPPPGFLLERGRFKPVAIPRVLEDLAPQGIGPIDINDRGQVVGVYSNTRPDISANDNQDRRGFLLDRGRYVRLDFPGSLASQAFDINDRGQVVGEYQDADGVFHGYVWEPGRFKTIDVPGQPSTAATGINNRGQITGGTGPVAARVGFLLDRGRFTTFTVPGAQATYPFGINDQGQIVGFSVLSAPTGSGFLRDARGRLTAINRPGAAVTVAFDINNRGQIVGVAVNPEDLAGAQPTDPPPMGRMS